ncbi:MAG: LysR family transcriptional regulator [Pseudobdellovibrio sp.]
MKKPSLELLESLIVFAESGSLSKASDRLNMTQPALSMQLKRLEDFFDFPIFAEFHQTGSTQLHKWDPVSCMNGSHLVS